MNILIKTRTLFAGILGVLFTLSCTDLDEKVISAIPADQFLTTEEEFTSALGSAYANFGNFIGEPWSAAEVASDELVVPTRGADWDDGGNWRRLHLHTFLPGDDRLSNAWPELFGTVNAANRLIFQFENLPAENKATAQAFIDELKGLRGLAYYFLLDLYGNVPMVTDFAATGSPSNGTNFKTGRTAVWNFVVGDVESGLANLNKNVGETYGRFNFYAAHAILAKLYLNSGWYLESPMSVPPKASGANLDKALTSIDIIVNSGNYSLETNYFDNFSTDNESSRENIMVIVYDNVFAGGMNLGQRTLHYQSNETFNLAEQPWNGYSSLADFYNSFIDPAQNPGPQGTVIGLDGAETTGTLDVRRGNFLVGPQFKANGIDRIIDPSVETGDPDGGPITFTPNLNQLKPNTFRQAGARIGKYEFGPFNQNQPNDYPIFRLADIILMKAEIMLEKGMNAEALMYVNMIRQRAGVDDLTFLDADALLAERGREVAFEYWRRQDLIRFGKWNTEWWAKRANPDPATETNEPGRFAPEVQVFPIPKAQIEANDNLTQNPGH